MERTEAGFEEQHFLEEVQRRQRKGGDLNAVPEEYANSPLIVAAERNWCTAARWLLDHGANVDSVDQVGWTALHNAACAGKYELISLLLDAGARIDVRSREQNTALHFVGGVGDYDGYESCKLLLSRGAAYDIRNTQGKDPETRLREKGLASAADLVADVRRAGGWAPYVAAPRNELLELRRTLPTLRHTPSVPLLQRLFKEVPEDVFVEVFAFWRSPRDV